MQESITIMGIKICVNDKLRANKTAQSRGICKCDQIVEVRALRSSADECIIGLYSHQPVKGWGDLSGTVPPGHGSWQESRYFLNLFELVQQNKVVAKDFNFKKRNLKGMRCKVVHHNRSQGHSFVEFDENVGGGSADGLGKTGFCVVLPSELLENVNKPSKDDPEEKKKAVKEVVEVDELPPIKSEGNEIRGIDPIDSNIKELWAFNISGSKTLDPEPIAIKAKIATKQSNIAKQKQRLAVKWNKDSEGNEIRWIDPINSNIFERDLFGE